MLTQQRSRKKKNHPLIWTISVADHVPSGMTYDEAAHMELKEELGFDTKLVVYEKELFREKNETQMVTAFLGKFPDGVKIVFNQDEVEECRFADLPELEELNKKDGVEEGSLNDFKKFFRGDFDELVKEL